MMIATIRQIIIRNFFCEQKTKETEQINLLRFQGPAHSSNTDATHRRYRRVTLKYIVWYRGNPDAAAPAAETPHKSPLRLQQQKPPRLGFNLRERQEDRRSFAFTTAFCFEQPRVTRNLLLYGTQFVLLT